jgi:hypothetical protein
VFILQNDPDLLCGREDEPPPCSLLEAAYDEYEDRLAITVPPPAPEAIAASRQLLSPRENVAAMDYR